MNKLLYKINRFFNKKYANLCGYFWLPCPICGEYFGGHEWGIGSLMTSPSRGKGVCNHCIKKAEEINRKNGFIK
jgi:hypothetical protein